jgi:hypothetical protein
MMAVAEETPYSITAFVMEHTNFGSLPTAITGPLMTKALFPSCLNIRKLLLIF